MFTVRLIYMYKNMKKAYRMFKRNDRGGVYYIQENGKNNPRSLETTDKAQAQRLLDAENQAIGQNSSLNLQLGRVFISNANPKMVTRTWQEAINELSTHGKESSRQRYSKSNFLSLRYLSQMPTTPLPRMPEPIPAAIDNKSIILVVFL